MDIEQPETAAGVDIYILHVLCNQASRQGMALMMQLAALETS